MKIAITLLLAFCSLSFIGCADTKQKIYTNTNSIGQDEAVSLALHLAYGMSEENAIDFLNQNGLTNAFKTGDSFSWGDEFSLSNHCSLCLTFVPEPLSPDGAWTNGRLRKVSIFYWKDQQDVLISLTNTVVAYFPPNDLKALSDISNFHAIPAATNLPPTVFKLCADGKGWLAELGERWNLTNVADPNLPCRQFVWAETDGYYYVVHYESGGVGKSFHFLVVKLKDGKGKPDFVWHGGGPSIEDYPTFLEALKTGEIGDNPPYVY